MASPRFLVVGCGAVGIVYTYVLSRAIPENNIYALCRSNRQQATLDGFRLDSGVWGNGLRVMPNVVASVTEAIERCGNAGFDYIIISTKCKPRGPSIVDLIQPAVLENTVIVLLQNGIGIETDYHVAYPTNPIISGVVYIKSIQTSPAVVTHNNVQHLHIGTFPPDAPKPHKEAALNFSTLLKSAGASVTVHEDVQVERWSKALVNTAWDPISALSRLGDASFLATHEDAPGFVKELMLEVASVAQAHGYQEIGNDLVETQLGRAMDHKPPGIKMSMMIDALYGKPLEVDAIVGNVLALAMAKGVSTPLLRTTYFLVQGLNESFQSAK